MSDRGERIFFAVLVLLHGIGWTLALGSIGVLLGRYGYENLYYLAWIGGFVLFFGLDRTWSEKSNLMQHNSFFVASFIGVGIGFWLVVSTVGLALNWFGFELSFQIAIVMGILTAVGLLLLIRRSGD